MIDIIIRVSSDLLGVALTEESNFFDSGGDSLLAVELVTTLDEDYDISVDLGELFFAETLRDLAPDKPATD